MGFIRLPRAHQILRKMRDGRIRRLNLNRDLAPRERLISFASADGYCLGLRPRVFPFASGFAFGLPATADKISLGSAVARNGYPKLPGLFLPRDHFDSDWHGSLHSGSPGL
jgi:hypothetical protein